MARSLASTLTAAVRPALRAWDRIPIRTQGRITVGLPLLAVIISACLAANGNYERVRIEQDIQAKFEMTAALGDLTSLMVNAETGVRGYLLTGQDDFLEPFDQASRALPGTYQKLNGLASEEPGDDARADAHARLRTIQGLTDQQMADLVWQRNRASSTGNAAADPEIRGHLAFGKGLMDRIRAEASGLENEVRGRLDDRLSDINTTRIRDYVSVVVALLAALATRFLAWYLFRAGTLRRVERLTENVQSIRRGEPPPFPPPPKQDKLGELEREVIDAVTPRTEPPSPAPAAPPPSRASVTDPAAPQPSPPTSSPAPRA